MLTGTALSEKIASNSQQKSIAFEAADSSIQSVWDPAYIRPQLAASVATDAAQSKPVKQPDSITGLLSDYDIQTQNGIVDLSGEVTIQYCGETNVLAGNLNADESSITLTGLMVDVTGTVNIENTNARSLVVKRGVLTAPRTGRSGSCVTY